MAKTFEKLRSLSASERALALKAVLLLHLFWLRLRISSIESLKKRLERGNTVTKKVQLPVDKVIATVSSIAWRMPWVSTCLTRALCCFVLLRESGHKTSIRIGVDKNIDGSLQAHAWLEDERGLVISEEQGPVGRYAEVTRWP